MTCETYTNLRRVEERRKKQATYSGNWQEVQSAITRLEKLDAEYACDHLPEPAICPDKHP